MRIGFEGGTLEPQLKGSCISMSGASKFVIWGGIYSGRRRANTTIAKESNNIVPSTIESKRRLFRFLRFGLKTGNSPEAETPFAFTDLRSTTEDCEDFSPIPWRKSSITSAGGGSTTKSPGKSWVFVFDPSSERLNSSAVWKRSAGSIPMALSIVAANRRETLLLRLRKGVSWVLSIARANPSSGIIPLKAAYKVAPSE